MNRENVASGNDVVAIQVAQVMGRENASPEPTSTPSGPSISTNIRQGNARVGVQTDVVTGDIRINF